MAEGKRSSDLYNKLWPAIYGVITLIFLYVFIPMKNDIKEMRLELKSEINTLKDHQDSQFNQFYQYYENCKNEINNIRKETSEQYNKLKDQFIAMIKYKKVAE
jgi:hypothetical protein